MEGQPGAPSTTCSPHGEAVRGAGGPGQAGALGPGAGCPSQVPTRGRPVPTGPTGCGWCEGGPGLPSPGAHTPCSLPALPPSGHGQRLLPACWTASPFRLKRAEQCFPSQPTHGTVGDPEGTRGAVCRASMRPPCHLLHGDVCPVPSTSRAPSPGPPDSSVLRLPRALARLS